MIQQFGRVSENRSQGAVDRSPQGFYYPPTRRNDGVMSDHGDRRGTGGFDNDMNERLLNGNQPRPNQIDVEEKK